MKILIFSLLAIFVLSGCSKEATTVDIEETAQQVGDVMASIDESGGSSGSLATLESEKRLIARKTNSTWMGKVDHFVQQYIFPIPTVEATACKDASTFSACTSNVITRDFNSCTIGGATFSGTVQLTFADAAVNSTCLMASAGHSVTRVPNFTATGRRGATLTVSKTSTNGQVITRGSTADTYTLSNDGIRRVLSLSGTTLFDFTTQTTSDISITGSTRSNRVMDGGTLRVTNNVSGVTCDISPSSVTWASTCNCAVSGSWSGTCSDSSTTTVDITGCGTGTITTSAGSQSFSFDRCYSL